QDFNIFVTISENYNREMAWTLIVVTSLVMWALHLMEGAVQRQEFSRMLAGMLVVAAAGGVLTTYFIMSDYVAFLHETTSLSVSGEWVTDYAALTEGLN
ncbi:MAG: hypothetical protein AAFX40_18850, partial [Cyanobacteria bacterium J06639_1]